MTPKNGKKGKPPGSGRPQHQVDRFADEIIAGKNATQAALAVSPHLKHTGAKNKGRRMMAEPRVQERIRERFNDAASLTSEEVMGTLAAHLRTDASDFVEIFNPELAEKIRRKNVGHLISEIEIREDKISYGQTAAHVEMLAKQMEKDGASLTPNARSTLQAAASPTSRTVRVRFHNSQQAAGKLSKLMGMELVGRERDRDAKIRARVLEGCKRLADKWGRPIEQVLRDYCEQVPEHAKYFNGNGSGFIH